MRARAFKSSRHTTSILSHHSPSGRVGLSGPVRDDRETVFIAGIVLRFTLPGRGKVRPSRWEGKERTA